MPIVTLLDKLESQNCYFDCYVNGVTIKNQQINCFTVSKDSIWILTEDSHEIDVKISEFSQIDFDAIVQHARTSLDMLNCLRLLEDAKNYNVYLRRSKTSEGIIMAFYRVRRDADSDSESTDEV
ncbi:hypothetical protein H8B09_10125 [Paenibacillus sp. PR3]|uniref:Proliferating cell nuclear antigen PCNA N-terminal domain-containing protein n=1 Tax=Paenibacillus terricola TaxID=2763503 RepID=A0ABR8MV11_9BACL|nr:hypothetical protein [Paenibacillus terricola]MBD3919111.1 hypothetical protein [Paenibacillus terricola]